MYKLELALWEITSKCNLKCTHCINNSGMHSDESDLTTQEGLSLIEQLHELGCKNVVLSGGEPFLRKDWSIFAQKIQSLGMGLHFMTNGTVINDDDFDILMNLQNIGISFSLDGAVAETHDAFRGQKGAFDRLLIALDKAVKYKINTSVSSTITKKNFHEIENIINLLIKHGVKYYQIQLGKLQGRMPEDIVLNEREYYSLAEQIVKLRKKYANKINIVEADCIGYYSKLSPHLEIKTWTGCQCGINIVCIDSEGNIKGCPHRHDSEGNFVKSSLKDIWCDYTKFAYNRRFEPDNLIGYCRQCKYGNLCRGGCAVNTRSARGTEKETPYCLYKIETYGYSD